jgi:hypothetical protein
MTQIVLTCRDPRVVAAWQAFAEAARLYGQRVTEIVDAAACGDRFTVLWEPCAGLPGRFAGIAARPAVPPPPGWRTEGALAVPDPALAAGRWAVAAVAAAGHPGDPQLVLPGLPAGAAQLAGFAAELSDRGTAVRVSWDGDLLLAGVPDERIWERASVAATGAGEDLVLAPDQRGSR